MGDYYRVLGVDVGASTAEIEQAYREQVRRHHPDLHPGDAAAQRRFQAIQTAFDALHDPVRREDYDLTRRLSRGATRPGAEPAGEVDREAVDDELDALRFFRQPGTAMVPYRRRRNWLTCADWMHEPDFVLPLALIAPLVAVHVVWVAIETLSGAWH